MYQNESKDSANFNRKTYETVFGINIILTVVEDIKYQ